MIKVRSKLVYYFLFLSSFFFSNFKIKVQACFIRGEYLLIRCQKFRVLLRPWIMSKGGIKLIFVSFNNYLHLRYTNDVDWQLPNYFAPGNASALFAVLWTLAADSGSPNPRRRVSSSSQRGKCISTWLRFTLELTGYTSCQAKLSRGEDTLAHPFTSRINPSISPTRVPC